MLGDIDECNTLLSQCWPCPRKCLTRRYVILMWCFFISKPHWFSNALMSVRKLCIVVCNNFRYYRFARINRKEDSIKWKILFSLKTIEVPFQLISCCPDESFTIFWTFITTIKKTGTSSFTLKNELQINLFQFCSCFIFQIVM